MPLFACARCNTVENTALGWYWTPALRGKEVLCSECKTGTWHGRFPKEDAAGWEPDNPTFPEFLREHAK